jgi:hypothetical protein
MPLPLLWWWWWWLLVLIPRPLLASARCHHCNDTRQLRWEERLELCAGGGTWSGQRLLLLLLPLLLLLLLLLHLPQLPL